jgi:hypothetical protein
METTSDTSSVNKKRLIMVQLLLLKTFVIVFSTFPHLSRHLILPPDPLPILKSQLRLVNVFPDPFNPSKYHVVAAFVHLLFPPHSLPVPTPL